MLPVQGSIVVLYEVVGVATTTMLLEIVNEKLPLVLVPGTAEV